MSGIAVTTNGAGPAPDSAEGSVREPDAPVKGSLLAQVRASAQRQSTERQATINVGGEFGDHLRVVYRPPSINDADRYGQLAETAGPTAQAIEMLVDCAVRLEWHADGEVTVLEDDQGQVRYGQRLWNLLGLPEREVAPHEVVQAVFGGNLKLLDDHVQALNVWFGQAAEDGPGGSLAVRG